MLDLEPEHAAAQTRWAGHLTRGGELDTAAALYTRAGMGVDLSEWIALDDPQERAGRIGSWVEAGVAGRLEAAPLALLLAALGEVDQALELTAVAMRRKERAILLLPMLEEATDLIATPGYLELRRSHGMPLEAPSLP